MGKRDVNAILTVGGNLMIGAKKTEKRFPYGNISSVSLCSSSFTIL